MNNKTNNYFNYGLSIGLVAALGLGIGALVLAGQDSSKPMNASTGNLYHFLMQRVGGDIPWGIGTTKKFGALPANGVVEADKDSTNVNNIITIDNNVVAKAENQPYIDQKKLGTPLLTEGNLGLKEALELLRDGAEAGVDGKVALVDIFYALRKSGDSALNSAAFSLLDFQVTGLIGQTKTTQDFDLIIGNLEALLSSSDTDELSIGGLITDGSAFGSAVLQIDGDEKAKSLGFTDKKTADKYKVFGFNLSGTETPTGIESNTDMILAVEKATGEIIVGYKKLDSAGAVTKGISVVAATTDAPVIKIHAAFDVIFGFNQE